MAECARQLHKHKLTVVPTSVKPEVRHAPREIEKWTWKTSIGVMVMVSGAAWLGLFVVLAA